MPSSSAKSKSNKAEEKKDSYSPGAVSYQNYSCFLAPLHHQLNSRLALRLQWWWTGSQTSPMGVNKLSKSYLLSGPPPKYSRIMSRRMRATLIPYKKGNFIYRGRITVRGNRDDVWRCWAYGPTCCSSDFWTKNLRVLPTTHREKQKLISTQFQLGQVA